MPRIAFFWLVFIMCVGLNLPIAQSSQPTAKVFAPAPPKKETEFQKRRTAIIEDFPPNSIFFLLRRPNDLEYNLPDKYFYYLSGTVDSNILIILISNPNPSEHLFLPKRNLHYEQWNGKRLFPGEEAQKLTGFQSILPFGFLNQSLIEFLGSLQSIHFENAYYSPPKSKKEELALDLIIEAFIKKRYLRKKNARELIAKNRLVKSPFEIEQLQKAINITGEALVEAMRFAQSGQQENEIQAVIEYFFTKLGANRIGFSSIIGSGPNSCILHYNKGQRKIEPGELVVMDVGAEFNEYTADVTRTIPVDGKFSPRQKEIYEIVLQAQKEAISIIKPGISFRQVDLAARKVIAKAGYAHYFIHSTSHWLGLNVHDVGTYRTKLEAGMVLTVEPGIYIGKEKLGIRIEDDVLVTKDGFKVLSGHIPKEVHEIEALMAEKSYLVPAENKVEVTSELKK